MHRKTAKASAILLPCPACGRREWRLREHVTAIGGCGDVEPTEGPSTAMRKLLRRKMAMKYQQSVGKRFTLQVHWRSCVELRTCHIRPTAVSVFNVRWQVNICCCHICRYTYTYITVFVRVTTSGSHMIRDVHVYSLSFFSVQFLQLKWHEIEKLRSMWHA